MADWNQPVQVQVGGAGLLEEWGMSKHIVASKGLMVDVYPYYFNALWGNQFAFTTTCATDIDAAALGPTKVVVCWTEPNDPLLSIRVRAGLYREPFVDWPVPGRVAARPGYIPRIAAIGPSKFVVAYDGADAVTVACGRVDLQSDVEMGTALEMSSTACDMLDVCGYDENKFCVAFQKENDSNRGYYIIGSVPLAEGGAGLAVTKGSAATFTTRRVDRIKICAINTGHLAVIFRDMDDGKGYVRAGAVSGTTVSWGAEVEFDAAWDGTGDVASLNEVTW